MCPPALLARPRLDAPAPPCYPGSVTEPKRTTVLDSLTQFGGTKSMSEASELYGVPTGTIKRWAKERREGRVVELKVAPPPPAPSALELRTREAPGGLKAKMTLTAAVSDALGPRIRDNVRRTVDNLTAYLAAESERALKGKPDDMPADNWTPVDMQQLRATANALESVLGRGADLLAFDRSTGGEVAAPASDDLAAAMGVKVPVRGQG